MYTTFNYLYIDYQKSVPKWLNFCVIKMIITWKFLFGFFLRSHHMRRYSFYVISNFSNFHRMLTLLKKKSKKKERVCQPTIFDQWFWFYPQKKVFFKLKFQFCRQNIQVTEKMLENKISYFKKNNKFSNDHFFIGVISSVY